MRVTVMSPVAADVTIAQATAWLERSGWVRTGHGIKERVFDVWSNESAENLWLIDVPKPHVEQWDECSGYVADMIVDVATATGEEPASILLAMAGR